MKMKKAKDATGGPGNLANVKKRGTAKPTKHPAIAKVKSPMGSRKPNDLNRPGNDADRELDVLRGMDKPQGMQKKTKKRRGGY